MTHQVVQADVTHVIYSKDGPTTDFSLYPTVHLNGERRAVIGGKELIASGICAFCQRRADETAVRLRARGYDSSLILLLEGRDVTHCVSNRLSAESRVQVAAVRQRYRHAPPKMQARPV